MERLLANFNNTTPIYLQIVEIIKVLIISGNFQSGSKMRTVRDLALELKVNPNTVQKALIEIEKLGLVYTDSTNGRYVTDDHKVIDKYKQEYLCQITDEYIKNMKEIGYSKEKIYEFIKNY